jgi:hypothetical protein
MNFLSEIKKIRSLINLFEGKDNINEHAIIGDKIAQIISGVVNNEYNELIDENMDFIMLNDKLSNYEEIEDQVKDVFVSIGSEDFFDSRMDIDSLINNLDRIFPNAEIHLIKGYVNSIEFNLDDKNKELIENNSVSFFNIFRKNRINIVGNHNLVGIESLSQGEDIIIDLIEIINNYVGEADTEEEKDEYVEKFNDLDIDEETDFDEIYEFLSLFEKMVKSKNSYSTDLKNNFYGDVEMIQIALKFLEVPLTESLEISGKYDDKTKEAIKKYQISQSIKDTGIADTETLEEILWDLKTKSFDDEDLAGFLSNNGVELKVYEPDDIDLEDIIDKIIDNIEGGYAAPEHFQASAEKQKDPSVKKALLNSGETMFGIDRKNGPTMTEFWDMVDENSGYAAESEGKPKWQHGYMGGSVEDELREFVYDWAIPYYEKLKEDKLSSELKQFLEEDNRLATHFMYACWNGILFYNDFKNELESAISEGVTDRDELWEIAINTRKNHSNGVVRLTAPKVEKIATE